MATKQPKEEPIVVPEIAPIAPEPKEDKPRKAFTVERVPSGWSRVIVTYIGDKVIDIDRTEPDLKAVALERFKIDAVKYWRAIE